MLLRQLHFGEQTRQNLDTMQTTECEEHLKTTAFQNILQLDLGNALWGEWLGYKNAQRWNKVTKIKTRHDDTQDGFWQ